MKNTVLMLTVSGLFALFLPLVAAHATTAPDASALPAPAPAEPPPLAAPTLPTAPSEPSARMVPPAAPMPAPAPSIPLAKKVELQDGSWALVDGDAVKISTDNGENWVPAPDRTWVARDGSKLATKNGKIIK